jgi:hypothetical protein
MTLLLDLKRTKEILEANHMKGFLDAGKKH